MMYFLYFTCMPIGACKHFATCITRVDQANIEGVIRYNGHIFACTTPDKACILTHCNLWKWVAGPYCFLITKCVADGQLPCIMPPPRVFVKPGLILQRIIVQLAAG